MNTDSVVKTCCTCKEDLTLHSFYKDASKKFGVSNQCRTCKKESNRLYRLKNGATPREKLKKSQYPTETKEKYKVKLTEEERKERQRKSCRDYYQRKKSEDPDYAKKKYLKRKKENPNFKKLEHQVYYQKNKDKIKAKAKQRRAEDSVYALGVRTRNLIRGSFFKKGKRKNSKTQKILGCTIPEFHQHLESLFKEGMSWENRSEWEIDHIIPIKSAKTESDIIRLNHYKNLQPLWMSENRSKGAKI